MNSSENERAPLPDILGLLLLGSLFLAGQMLWSVYDTFGEANLVGVANSLAFYRSLCAHPGQLGLAGMEYPYLSYLTSSLFYRLFGFSTPIASLSLLIFIFPLLFALYGLGRRFGGRSLAWLLVFLTLSNPRTIFWSHSYTQNFPEMAMVALAFYLLIKNCDFKDPKNAAWFGLSLGLAWLTKYGVVFLLTPLVWRGGAFLFSELKTRKSRLLGIASALFLAALGAGLFFLIYYTRAYLALKNHFLLFQLLSLAAALGLIFLLLKPSRSLKPWQNFALALASALLIALPWYLQAADILFGQFGTYHATAVSKGADIFRSLHDFLVYAGLLYPGIIFFAAAGLLYALWQGKRLPYQLLLASSLGGLLILSKLILDPTYYNFFSLIPFMILLSICWVKALPGFARIGLALAALLWFLFNFSGVCALKSGFLPPANPLYPLWQKVVLSNHRDRYFNLEDTMFFVGMKEGTFNRFSLLIKENYRPGSDHSGIKILFLNRVPRLLLEERQLGTYLAAQGLGETGFAVLELRSEFPSTMFPFPEIDKLENFKNYRFYTPWDFLLLAAPRESDFSLLEKQTEGKGFLLRRLGEERNRQAVWGGKVDFILRLYALRRKP